MRRWRQKVRFGVLAIAGFVLLITAVPQVASAIDLQALANRLDGVAACSGSSASSGGTSCCSGTSAGQSGSGSGSGQCSTGPSTVVGTVTVTGAPAGFATPFVGVGACPFTGPGSVTTLCAVPDITLAANGVYTLTVEPGTWVVRGFYEITPFGGAFLGTPQVLTVAPGGTIVFDTTVPYAKPAKLTATVKVTGLPSGVALQGVSVLLCPAGSPYSGGVQPLACVDSGPLGTVTGPTTGTIAMAGLPGGMWTAYPGYCTLFGCIINSNAGVPVTLTAGKATRIRLATGYVVPQRGLVNATVSVSGAPTGFTSAVGITACQLTSLFSSCQGSGGWPTGIPIALMLGTGIWEITGEYYAPVFGNAITGPTEIIDVQGGQTLNLVVDVPYQVLGTAAGSINVAGLPSGVKITSYTVTACPTGPPFVALPFPFLSCVTEYSGPGTPVYGAADTRRLGRTAHRVALPKVAGTRLNSYSLPTLTPGQWQLSVGYTTAFGSFHSSGSTIVTIAGGQTTTTKLTVPYQAPTLGAVTGKVSVLGAPAYSFQTGARACSTTPTMGTCTNEVDAYLGQDGTYQLKLPKGTWWVSGIAYVYGPSAIRTATSLPRVVAVSAGVSTRENFTVPIS
jgi:hypothetical protein